MGLISNNKLILLTDYAVPVQTMHAELYPICVDGESEAESCPPDARQTAGVRGTAECITQESKSAICTTSGRTYVLYARSFRTVLYQPAPD